MATNVEIEYVHALMYMAAILNSCCNVKSPSGFELDSFFLETAEAFKEMEAHMEKTEDVLLFPI